MDKRNKAVNQSNAKQTSLGQAHEGNAAYSKARNRVIYPNQQQNGIDAYDKPLARSPDSQLGDTNDLNDVPTKD